MTRKTFEAITAAWLVVAAFYVGIMGTLALAHYAMEWMK